MSQILKEVAFSTKNAHCQMLFRSHPNPEQQHQRQLLLKHFGAPLETASVINSSIQRKETALSAQPQ